jgi:DNA-binding response OmpR family regulator
MERKITLLLAEDEPSLGQIIKESLETRGFDVLLCENGEKALEVYKTKTPKLLILDIMMPKKDGFTLAKEIRLEDADIPIIFLTSKSQTQDVVEGFHSGGNDYLKKPFSMEELIVRVNNLLQNTVLQEPHNSIELGDYIFDFTKQTLQFKDNPSSPLTHREGPRTFHDFKKTLGER